MSTNFIRSLMAAALLSLPFALPANAAETYKLDPGHSTVIWDAVHFGFSKPHGLFPMVNGTLTLDEKTPVNSKVEATISTAAIVTGNAKFDEHLKSADFFNVAKFPEAKFVSDKVEVTGKDTAKVTGNLTLLGVTKPVTLDVKLNKKDVNPFTKQPTVGFSATTTIKRSEFGINYAIPGVSDDVTIQIESEANPA